MPFMSNDWRLHLRYACLLQPLSGQLLMGRCAQVAASRLRRLRQHRWRRACLCCLANDRGCGGWDGDWTYHLHLGEYKYIEWCEITIERGGVDHLRPDFRNM